MNIETMKSVILVILIAFSMVLSAALWNYQPDAESVDDDGVVEDTKLEEIGSKADISELIKPVQYVFHEEGQHYSYLDKRDQSKLYQSMKEWSLLNVDTSQNNPELNDLQQRKLEIIFPTELPLKVLGDLFTIENPQLGNGKVFDRMFVVQDIDENSASYKLWVVNADEQTDPVKFSASLSVSAGDQLFSTLHNKEDLVEQIRVSDWNTTEEQADPFSHIYIPKGKVSYPEEVLQTNPVPVTPLQNDLFPSNTYVSEYYTNSGDRRLFSTYRRLDILEEQKRMEYVYMIPNEANPSYWSSYELFTRSLKDINKHLGWTNSFRVDSLSGRNTASYRMYFNKIPIYESPNRAEMMTMSYEQGVIQEYIRPLIQFERYTGRNETTAELPSGENVLDFLISSEKYDLDNIEDIQVGYSLVEEDNSLVYYLLPKWFVKRSGNWKVLKMNELSQNKDIS